MSDDQKTITQLREEVQCRPELYPEDHVFEPYTINDRKLIDKTPVEIGHLHRSGDLIAIIDGRKYILGRSATARAAVAFHIQQQDEYHG